MQSYHDEDPYNGSQASYGGEYPSQRDQYGSNSLHDSDYGSLDGHIPTGEGYAGQRDSLYGSGPEGKSCPLENKALALSSDVQTVIRTVGTI